VAANVVETTTKKQVTKRVRRPNALPDVGTPSEAWDVMEVYRQLPREIRGGIPQILGSPFDLLWKAAKEKEVDFKRRKRALQWSPFYWLSCQHLAQQPWTAPPTWSNDTPPVLVNVWAQDVDLTQRNFDHVARSSCEASVGYGLRYLLVLWHEVKGRPIIIEIPAAAVLDPWEEGAPVRVLMTDTWRDAKKPWIIHNREQVWMFWDGEPTAGGEDRFARWEVFERTDPKNPKSPWEETPTDGLGDFFINQEMMPLFPLYTGSHSPMDSLPHVVVPPLHSLATDNVVWMNKRSDLDWGLHVSNIPLRGWSGVKKAEVEAQDKISYKGTYWNENPAGKLYFAEHSGASFGIAQEELTLMERRMEIFGMSPMMSRETGNVTATGRRIDLSRAITTAQASALGWEDTWTQAWRAAARYRRLNDRFTMQVVTDFGPDEDNIDAARIVQTDFANGDLDPEDYYPTMVALGVYPESFDVEGAIRRSRARMEAEAKRLAAIPALPQPPAPPAEPPVPGAG
jgi:hypothetical protein